MRDMKRDESLNPKPHDHGYSRTRKHGKRNSVKILSSVLALALGVGHFQIWRHVPHII